MTRTDTPVFTVAFPGLIFDGSQVARLLVDDLAWTNREFTGFAGDWSCCFPSTQPSGRHHQRGVRPCLAGGDRGIVASAGLLGERHWGVILAIVSLSMALAGSLPYGIVRLSLLAFGGGEQAIALGVASIVLGVLNVLALLYWCRPGHRRGGRL